MGLFRKLTRKILAPSRPTYKLAGRDYLMRLRDPDLTPAIEMRILRNADDLAEAGTLPERYGLLAALVCDMYVIEGDDVDRVMLGASLDEMQGAADFFMRAYIREMTGRVREVGRRALR